LKVRLFALGITLAISTPTAVCGAEAKLDPRAVAAVERSRTTRQPYIVALKVAVKYGETQYQDTASEIHDWPMHRVENRDVHVVANCATQTAERMTLSTGNVTEERGDAASACGVGQPSGTLRALRWLGRAKRPSGVVDIVEMEDAKFVRRYEITTDGIIVLNDFTPKAEGDFSFKTIRVVYLKRGRPPAELFAKFLRPRSPSRE